MEMEEEKWTDLPPELLDNVVGRVQQTRGQGRRAVAMAGVCRTWRRQILGAKINRSCGEGLVIEFPWMLLQPGPRASQNPPIQCLLKRRGSHFLLFQTPRDERNGEQFLLAARRRWLPTGFSYIIGKDCRSLVEKNEPDVLGKLKSNFWASEFVLWEKQPSQSDPQGFQGAPVASLRFVEHIVNGIRQRRIQCALPQPCKGGGLAFVLEKRGNEGRYIPAFVHRSWLRWSCISNAGFKGDGSRWSSTRMLEIAASNNNNCEHQATVQPSTIADTGEEDDNSDFLELRSKIPAWDAQQQCWSLDFKGRATMPSMHNFQLIRFDPDAVGENIILQLGKIGKNMYTMDFCYPLSAFQAFAICLSSFATSAGLEP